jgi:hypothetical protein
MALPVSEGTAELIFAERLAAWSPWWTRALFGMRPSPTWGRVNLHLTRWGGVTVAVWGIVMLVFDVP